MNNLVTIATAGPERPVFKPQSEIVALGKGKVAEVFTDHVIISYKGQSDRWGNAEEYKYELSREKMQKMYNAAVTKGYFTSDLIQTDNYDITSSDLNGTVSPIELNYKDDIIETANCGGLKYYIACVYNKLILFREGEPDKIRNRFYLTIEPFVRLAMTCIKAGTITEVAEEKPKRRKKELQPA
jgi:hypothetical protein